MTIDWSAILSALGVIGFVYAFLRNFKADIGKKIDQMEHRQNLMDEKIFLLATGKTLKEALLEANAKSHAKE